MKKRAKRSVSILLTLVMVVYSMKMFTIPVEAAIVTPQSDALVMVNSLLSPGFGYAISNPQYFGDPEAVGMFSGANSVVGFDSGVVLSTGKLIPAGSIFSVGYATEFNSDTIEDLGGNTYTGLGFPSENFSDLSMLSFDIDSPISGFMSFQYCIASEEFPEWISVADQFVLSVNGVNYAVVPGTNTPVSIGNVNHGTNSNYYQGITPTSNDGAISTSEFVFDGKTVVFSVSAPVTAGTNSIVFAIADNTDYAFDSAVFIKAGSIKSVPANPGVYAIGAKTATDLNINRTLGVDGDSEVKLTFTNAIGTEISSSVLKYSDGENLKTVSIPVGAIHAIISNPTGGATLDPNATTKVLIEVETPTVSDPSDTTKNIGSTASFSVVASVTDGGTLSYQWQSATESTFTNISGATSSTYTTSALTYADNQKKYRCVVTNTISGVSVSKTTNAVTLTVNPEADTPAINTQPGDTTKNIGETGSFNIAASVTDSGSLTYQWQKNTGSGWSDISGANSTSYTTGTLIYVDNGTEYRCVVTNSKNATIKVVNSNAAILTVNPEAVTPAINTQPGDTTKNIGETGSFSVEANATDGGSLTYQWQKNTGSGWSDISGANSTSYTTDALVYADDGTEYRCVVTNSKNATTKVVNSNAAILTVNPEAVAPTINTQPVGVTKNIGETGSFSVAASAADSGSLTYQWEKNTGSGWSDISGANANTYTTDTLTYANNGTEYRCVITNSKNATTKVVNSNAVTLTVNPEAVTPTINTQPGDITKNIGETGSFSVAASAADSGSLTYQWQKNTGSGWSDIIGANANTYTTDTLAYSNNGTEYRCVVTNSKNATTKVATTNVATLTVNPEAVTPVINTQPVDISKNIYEMAEFGVVASVTDGGVLSYQWQKNTGSDWLDISSATSSTYTISSVLRSEDGNKYRCIITNSKNATITSLTSAEATLTVNPEAVTPTINTQPGDTTKNIGETGSFSISASASDSGSLTYQWQKNTGSGWSDISGETTNSYTTDALTYADNGTEYRCVVTNSKNATTKVINSNTATLTVNPEAVTPTINTQPGDTTKNIGETGSFSMAASASDSGSLTYQWQKNTGSGWSDISGANSTSYTTGTLTYADNGTDYRCVITNSKNATTKVINSNTAILTVNPEAVTPTINTQPGNTTKNIGETGSFSIAASASDSGNLTYQWQKNTGSGWSDIIGANSTSYTTGTLTYADNGTDYRCVVTNSKNATTKVINSNTAILTVNPEAVTPTINTQPGNTTKNIGETGSFSIAASASDSGSLTYQWQKNTGSGWSDISGANVSSFTTEVLTYVNNGTEYRCVVTNSKNATTNVVTSNTAILTVNPEAVTPTINTQPGDTAKNIGETGSFSIAVSASDSGSLTYQWQKNTGSGWSDISGETTNSYTTETLTYANNGTEYRCIVTNSKNATTKVVTSAVATLTVNPEAVNPVIISQPIDLSKDIDDTVEFSVNAEASDSGVLTYQWQKDTGNGWVNIDSATDSIYTIASASRSDDGTQYRCLITNTKNATSKTIESEVSTLVVGTTVKAVEKRIDELINPDTATDEEIISNFNKIKETKQLYDDLTNSERDTISSARKLKLNKLIERLKSSLVIDTKDQTSGIAAGGISTSVLLPELNDENVSKVHVKLEVVKLPDTNQPESVKKAFKLLAGDGKELVATYDMSLIKSIFGNDNQLVATGKISNSQIVDYITIHIPVPEGFEGRDGLTVVYIDDEGNVTPLNTKVVTIDGVKYLQFETNHFSQYAVAASIVEAATETPTTKAGTNLVANTNKPATGDNNDIIKYIVITVVAGIVVSFGVYRKKNKNIV